jgi:hypothetical protein
LSQAISIDFVVNQVGFMSNRLGCDELMMSTTHFMMRLAIQWIFTRERINWIKGDIGKSGSFIDLVVQVIVRSASRFDTLAIFQH